MKNNQSPSGDDFKVLTENRLKNFWGYGNLDATTWFIGMEEGLGKGAPYLMERFLAADGKATVDMRHDMQAVEDHNAVVPTERSCTSNVDVSHCFVPVSQERSQANN